jgi:hypothetical protein
MEGREYITRFPKTNARIRQDVPTSGSLRKLSSATHRKKDQSIKTDAENPARVRSNSFRKNYNERRVFVPLSICLLEIFFRSRANVIAKIRQAFGRKKNLIMLSFSARRIFLLHVPPESSKFNHLFFFDYEFPDFKKDQI